MLTFIGRKSDETILEKSGLRFSVNDTVFTAKLLAALEANYGVSGDDISMFQLADDSEELARIRRRDDYTVSWVDNEISGIDFSPEDGRNRYTVEVSSTQVSSGESVDVTIRLFQSDEVTPLDSVNASVRIPAQLPGQTAKVLMQFVNGVAQKTVTLNQPGTYTLGAHHTNGFTLKGPKGIVEVDL